MIAEENYQFRDSFRKKIFIAIGLGIIFMVLGCILLASNSGHDAQATTHTTVDGAEQDEYPHDPRPAVGEQDLKVHSDQGELTVDEHAEASADDGHHEGASWLKRLWLNLWLNNVYFTGIAIIGVFWIAVQYVSFAGWGTLLQRIPSSFGYYLPFGLLFALVFFFFGGHDIFHWTHESLYDKGGPDYDPIIAGKSEFLNTPFYVARMIVFYGLWFYYFHIIRKNSLNEDLDGGLVYYNKNLRNSAIFLVIFAVSSSIAAWDWVMSVDPHWFSTMFGWYVFASWFITGLAAITLATVLLKEAGYLPMINTNHLHDLGKYMFAFSIFWAYIWFSQFLLIYYANIPEESVYFVERMVGHGGHFAWIFYTNLIINFFFPFMALMTRDSKRQTIFLKIVAIALLFGHYLDFYLMMMPGTLGQDSGFGFVEIGSFLAFGGLFILLAATALSKGRLVPRNHPMLEESIHHEVH